MKLPMQLALIALTSADTTAPEPIPFPNTDPVDPKDWIWLSCGGGKDFCGIEKEIQIQADETAELRCCSPLPVSGWKTDRNIGCDDVWTQSHLIGKDGREQCFHNVTYAEAQEICALNGGHVCTKDQVESGCAKSSGCGHNGDLIWTGAPAPALEPDSGNGSGSGSGSGGQSGTGGDPHITTWKNEHYEYHGQCDVVMLKDAEFAEGLGLDIHIRTKIVRYWSYIKSVAIKIGNDILEIQGSADSDDAEAHYWINYEYQGELDTFAGFPATQKLPSVYKRSYTIDLSSKYPGHSITVQLYKEFVRVRFNGATTAFENSVGLLGDYKTGATFGRDGVTVINDFTDLGDEWQVVPSDGKLFRQAEHPQFPELCLKPEDPRGERQRRLSESHVTPEQAEAACGKLKDKLAIKDCVYDILATQDLDMVGAF